MPESRINFTALRPLAPTIVGIAIKNENSAAAVRVRPRSIAPRIVEPEREVPGIIARIWNNPIANAVKYDIDETSFFTCDFSGAALDKYKRHTVND